MALLFYALLLTQSRGGLLALMCGLVAMLRAKWGWKTAIGLGLAILPVLIIVAGERQSAISTSTETGNLRVELWSDGLMFVRSSPLFGIGRDEYSKQAGQVAHNSYLHAFGETGLLGGALFLGAFVFALLSLERLCPGGKRENVLVDPDLRHLQPYIMGGLVSYMVGMMTLTLTYMIPTFTVLAMAAVFMRMAAADAAGRQTVSIQAGRGGVATATAVAPRFDLPFLVRILLASFVFLVVMMIFVRFSR
jgi:O-antigen ligase